MLSLLLPGCSPLIASRETSPPPVVMPTVQEQAPTAAAPKVTQVGDASWYGPAQDGKETASGETFDEKKLTAAHPTLPMGTKAVVTNLETGKSVEVTINDRGPYAKGRKIDLSHAAADTIGMSEQGVAKVKIESRPRRKVPKVARRTTPSHETPVATPHPPRRAEPVGQGGE